MPDSGELQNPIDRLAEITGSNWKDLRSARNYTFGRRKELSSVLSGLDSDDTSVVVFGSLARDEASDHSDIDWTLLIDGIAVPQHLDAAQEIERRLDGIKAKKPGREGTFGDVAFSHQMLHWIGGEDDSNANTTRRILLLLESKPIGKVDAWERVVKNVLSRYLSEDRGLWDVTKTRAVPLFLLNDIARYWRMMVVDFAYKQRARSNKGYALRSFKLGTSRKLLFVSGLLACFSCHLDFSDDQWRELSKAGNPQPLIQHLMLILKMTPLEIIASRLVQYENKLAASKRLFDAYDRFIGLLADSRLLAEGKTCREHLEELGVDNLATDEVFLKAQEIRREFRTSLEEIFLMPGTDLYNLTIKHGVF